MIEDLVTRELETGELESWRAEELENWRTGEVVILESNW